MVRLLLVSLLASTVIGCAGTRVEYVPTKCPIPPEVVFEADPVDTLSDNASLAEVATAYRVSRLQWKNVAKDLKLKLDVYRGTR